VTDPDEVSRRLAAESLAVDDPTGWFERLYAAAGAGEAIVPWDRGAPHPLIVEWAERRKPTGERALVVGAGLGFDAEFVAGLGFDTTAFDISATAVQTAEERFPASQVRYRTADLLDPPAEWLGAFDLVVESLTVQSMPVDVRPVAIRNVAATVAPGGTLLVVAFAREAAETGQTGNTGNTGNTGEAGNAGEREEPGPPWPLSRADIDAFGDGLELVTIEVVASRWRAEFRRPGA
jgi:SAM-dependent methyltransferase